MAVSNTHILRQTPVIAALARTATVAALRKAGVAPRPLVTPTPPLKATVGPRAESLVRDYIRAVGGDPSWYRGVVPAHMFPQWGFPLLSRTLSDIPYDMTKVLNGGVRIVVNAPLPAGEPLHLRATLEDVDDNGSRAVLHQKLVTGTASAPEALECHLYAIVPLKKSDGPKKDKPRVPEGAREIARIRATPQKAWEFAVLTGDFNPVHWVPAYARASGFKNTILHGFATLALALEAVNKVVFAGNPARLGTVDVRFTRPLVLPKTVGVYLDDSGLHVGDTAGGPAYLSGSLTPRD